MRFDALWDMWRMVIAEFGIAACDKGDTLYWRWDPPVDLLEDPKNDA